MIVNMVKGTIGSIQGLNVEQVYIKLKLVISMIPLHSRLEESCLPIIFLDILVPNSVIWPTTIRLQELL